MKSRGESRNIKDFIFRYYINIAIAASLVLIAVKLLPRSPLNWSLTFTILGGILSFVYLTQKQKLEETKLFKDLFSEFNHRYDKLNNRLNHIREVNPDEKLTHVQKSDLYDYFNLCGEEYLYFKQGYIPAEVWKAWVNGMKIFCEDERIRKFWEDDLETNSYYGFNLGFLTKREKSQF